MAVPDFLKKRCAMQINPEIEIGILVEKYGFKPTTEDDQDEDNGNVVADCDYKYEIGHSRRGQFYYLLVKNRSLQLYASEPDGSGGKVGCPDVLIRLIKDGILVEG